MIGSRRERSRRRTVCSYAVALSILLPAAITGCAGPTAVSQPYARFARKIAANKTAIVFVHGVLGDARTTWTNSATGAYWPQLLMDDDAFASANVYVYGFKSPLAERTYSIDEVAENLRLALTNDRVFADHDEVVFLAHSMGGLVVRSFLLKYRSLVDKVPMIYFLAAPTTGSAVANVARILGANVQFGQLAPMQSEDFLADLQRNWLAAKFQIRSYCAYELKPTFGIIVVPQSSAANLCTERLDPIDANHIDIVKPAGANDASHMGFRSAFQEAGARKSESIQDAPLRIAVTYGDHRINIHNSGPANVMIWGAIYGFGPNADMATAVAGGPRVIAPGFHYYLFVDTLEVQMRQAMGDYAQARLPLYVFLTTENGNKRTIRGLLFGRLSEHKLQIYAQTIEIVNGWVNQ